MDSRPPTRTALSDADGFVQDPQANDYLAAAEFALRDKNLPQAIEQIAAALAFDPLDARCLRVLDAIRLASRAPLLLVELGEHETFFGLFAVRARLLAHAGRWSEALVTLAEVAAFRPSIAYFAWADQWTLEPGVPRRVEPKAFARALAGWLTSATQIADERVTAHLELGSVVAARVGDAQPADVHLLVVRSRMLRALSRYEAARSLLTSTEIASCWELEVERAALHGELGEEDAQIRCLEAARALRPRDAATHFDLGDCLLRAGLPSDAAAAFDSAVESEAAPNAALLRDYAHWLATGDLGLRDWSANRTNDASASRLDALTHDVRAFDTWLPDPLDPLVAVIRSALVRAAREPEQPSIRVKVRSELPATPSAQLAFALGARHLGKTASLQVESATPLGSMTPLWALQAGAFVPHGAPPSEPVSLAVAALAETPFAWKTWCDTALSVASNYADPAEFARAMAHLGALPPSADAALTWVGRAQTAAALLVAGTKALPSERLGLLAAITAAQDDWSAASAWLGLRALRAFEPGLEADIRSICVSALSSTRGALPASARALATVGAELTTGDERRAFLRLRARVLAELDAWR